jgi:tight adherence protein B
VLVAAFMLVQIAGFATIIFGRAIDLRYDMPLPILSVVYIWHLLVLPIATGLLIFGKTLKREKKVNRRLALLQDGKDTEEVLSILRAEREGIEKHDKMPVIGPLVEMARHASITLTIGQIALSLIGLTVVAFLLLTLFTGAVIQIRVVVALITGYAAFYIWLRGKAKKRISLFEEQLPDALDLMVRSLRVGHPMTAAIGIVAREMADPLGTELGLIADEAPYGMSLTDAIRGRSHTFFTRRN